MRRPFSVIRENIKKILSVCKELNGYEIYKIYIKVFPRVTMRSIYYNLAKGVELKEFMISKIKEEQGRYSWGDRATKVFYSLSNEEIDVDDKTKNKIKEVKEALDKIKNEKE